MPVCNRCHIPQVGLLTNCLNPNSGTDVSYCEICYNHYYRQCFECNLLIIINNGTYAYSPSGEMICEHCTLKYFYCLYCQRSCSVLDRISEGLCKLCKIKDDNTLIKRHDYKPFNFRFYGKAKSLFYMGIELEVECKSNEDDGYISEETIKGRAKKVKNILGDFCYLKKDGSLSNGFEIVSYPATLNQHREKLSGFLDKPPTGLISYDSDNCGLHVHASRKNLADITIARVVVFVNSQMNRGFITKLAQRSSNNYSKFKYKTIDNYFSEEKYEAVNLLPKDTIEFRIFKGTLNKKSVFRSLEFVDAIIKYCTHQPTEKCVSYKDFIQHVITNKRYYPELHRFCIEFIKQTIKEDSVKQEINGSHSFIEIPSTSDNPDHEYMNYTRPTYFINNQISFNTNY